jgi:dTDP-glucose 4,6-dehydratase
MTTTHGSLMITGGAGFIGQNLVHRLARTQPDTPILVVDAMTYAANPSSLKPLIDSGRITFVEANIIDVATMRALIEQHAVTRIAHLAAESHVDRSILGPDAFFETNIQGTYSLLKAARAAWGDHPQDRRFLHVSTDEVFGDLEENDPPFDEQTPYRPSSPYSASKAASDHLARAFHRTYGVPVTVTNCSNNYGPYQHPEKLIPLVILNALRGIDLPIYGDGRNIRDWLFVEDHCAGIEAALMQGEIGETYCIGGGSERRNIEVVQTICDAIDARLGGDPALSETWSDSPAARGGSCRDLIRFVKDRPGHDHRYAIDSRKIARELGVTPSETFESGIARTVDWYIANADWWQQALTHDFSDWMDRNYSAGEAAAAQ